MSAFTSAELNRIYREAMAALREMHRNEYWRILVAIKAREEGRKIASGNIQSPLVAVARDLPRKHDSKPKREKPRKATRSPGRPRSDAWADVDRIRELHAERIPLGQQVEILGITRDTLKRIRASEGLSYGYSGACPSLSAAPLLSLLASRSLSYGSERAMLNSVAMERGVSFDALDRAIKRAKATGKVTERTAERLALYLGRRVEDLWEREAS